MERELTVERTRAGLDVAKQLGRKGGRKPKMTDSKIESAKKLLASGVPPIAAHRDCGNYRLTDIDSVRGKTRRSGRGRTALTG